MTDSVRTSTSMFVRACAATALCALLGCATFALAGCGSDASSSADEQQTTEQQAASAEEQDNCYGDDLPVINQ